MIPDTIDITLAIIITTAAMCAVGAAWIILDPRIHEGLFVKVGLVMICLGSYALIAHVADAGHLREADDIALVRSIALCSAGLLCAVVGLLWRIYRLPLGSRGTLVGLGSSLMGLHDDDEQQPHWGDRSG